MCVCMCVCACVSLCMCACARVHVCAHRCVCLHVYTHIYHTSLESLPPPPPALTKLGVLEAKPFFQVFKLSEASERRSAIAEGAIIPKYRDCLTKNKTQQHNQQCPHKVQWRQRGDPRFSKMQSFRNFATVEGK